MKKLSIALCVVLCMSLFGGCITDKDVSSSSLPEGDNSAAQEVLPDPTATTTTTTTVSENADDATSDTAETAASITSDDTMVIPTDPTSGSQPIDTTTVSPSTSTTTSQIGTQPTTVTPTDAPAVTKMTADPAAKTTTSTTAATTEAPAVTTNAPTATSKATTTKAPTTTTKAPTTTSTTTTTRTKPNVSRSAIAIAVDTLPKKTTYKTGDTLDTTGLVLKLSFNDGTTETVSSGYTTHGYNLNTPGNKTVTVAYNHGASTLVCEYTVNVEKKNHGTPNINVTYHDDMADDVLSLLNKARKEAGLSELKMDNGNLKNAAKIRAKEITIDWAHERPDHDEWYTVFDEENVSYTARGENLADGFDTVDSVFEAWMNSIAHRNNILSAQFTHISIVCMEYNGHFYWVQLFGGN